MTRAALLQVAVARLALRPMSLLLLLGPVSQAGHVLFTMVAEGQRGRGAALMCKHISGSCLWHVCWHSLAKASHTAEPMSRPRRFPAFLGEGPPGYTVTAVDGWGRGRKGPRTLRQSAPCPIWNSWKHNVIYAPGKGFSADQDLLKTMW